MKHLEKTITSTLGPNSLNTPFAMEDMSSTVATIIRYYHDIFGDFFVTRLYSQVSRYGVSILWALGLCKPLLMSDDDVLPRC